MFIFYSLHDDRSEIGLSTTLTAILHIFVNVPEWAHRGFLVTYYLMLCFDIIDKTLSLMYNMHNIKANRGLLMQK